MKPKPRFVPKTTRALFYTVYDDRTGEEVFRGSKRQCAEFILDECGDSFDDCPYGIKKDGKEDVRELSVQLLSNWANRPTSPLPLGDMTEEEYRTLMTPITDAPEPPGGKIRRFPATLSS